MIETNRAHSTGPGRPCGPRCFFSNRWALGLLVALALVLCSGCRSSQQPEAASSGQDGPRWIFGMAASPRWCATGRHRVGQRRRPDHLHWASLLDRHPPRRRWPTGTGRSERGTKYWWPDWSADGSHLLFITVRLKPLRTLVCRLVSVNFASGATRELCSAPMLGTRALWLPGDAGVVFEASSDWQYGPESLFYLLAGSKAEPRRLTPSGYSAHLLSVAPAPLGTSWRAFYLAFRDPFVEGEGFEHELLGRWVQTKPHASSRIGNWIHRDTGSRRRATSGPPSSASQALTRQSCTSGRWESSAR